VVTAVSLLHDVGAGHAPKIGRRVVIYGAGDTAMDAARTAKRLGATEALVVFFSDRAHMKAHSFEATEALSEGVKIKWLSSIRDIDEGALTVELMALDAKGIPQPTGTFETLQADSVILALGQQAESGIFAGGDVVMTTSAILGGGIDVMATLVQGLHRWMDEREFIDLDAMRGLLSWERSKDRSVYTRANYLRILEQYSAA